MADRPRFHLSLRVRPESLDALTDFYALLFGAPPRKRHADHVQFDVAEPPLNFSLVPTPRASTGELDHLGVQVFSDEALRDARTRLLAAGLALREEPQVECCYSRQDKFWVLDPEGREVEVFHRLEDIAEHGHGKSPAAPATSSCCEPTCCTPA